MTAQEKTVLLKNLQTVTGIFQEFEQAYNMVVSLPQQKQAIYNEINVPKQIKSVASTGSSAVVGVIAYIVLFIPCYMVLGFILGIVSADYLVNHFGTVILIVAILDVFAAKFAAKLINEKIKAGGNKLQDSINQKIRTSNDAASAHNIDVDKQIALAEQKCEVLRQKVAQMDMSWYPPDYYSSDASSFFYKALNNGRCETLGEAVNLYEEHLYRDQTLANQQKQIDLAFTQCVLQAMTIDAIHSEGAATRETIMAEGAATRSTIMSEGAATRGAINMNTDAVRAAGKQVTDALNRGNDILNKIRRGR